MALTARSVENARTWAGGWAGGWACGWASAKKKPPAIADG